MYWIKKYFSQPTVHFRAFSEVAIVFLFSLAPYFITAFVRAAKDTESTGLQFLDLFEKGQIYLLAYALFGTVFWLGIVRWDRPRHDARIALGVLAIILVIPIIGFLGVDPTFSTVANPAIVRWGFWFYAAFLFIQYLLLFYIEIEPPDTQQIFDRGIKDLDREYDRFKNEQ